jgi:hypothetical protein
MLLKYYKDLFGPAHGNFFRIDQNLWSPNEKLNEEDNSDMIKPFSEHEVKYALFATEKKSPGTDSIPIEFYSHCLEFVKNDIMVICGLYVTKTLYFRYVQQWKGVARLKKKKLP